MGPSLPFIRMRAGISGEASANGEPTRLGASLILATPVRLMTGLADIPVHLLARVEPLLLFRREGCDRCGRSRLARPFNPLRTSAARGPKSVVVAASAENSDGSLLRRVGRRVTGGEAWTCGNAYHSARATARARARRTRRRRKVCTASTSRRPRHRRAKQCDLGSPHQCRSLPQGTASHQPRQQGFFECRRRARCERSSPQSS